MGGRSKVMKYDDESLSNLKLTEKEVEIIKLVSPFEDHPLSQRSAAIKLGISLSAVVLRLKNVYKKVPGIQERFSKKREAMSKIKRKIERPRRYGDMEVLDYGEDRIVRKF